MKTKIQTIFMVLALVGTIKAQSINVTSTGVGIGTTIPERKLDVKGSVNVGSVEEDYLPDGGNWNYTLRLNARDNTSIGFHDAAHAVSSIRFNGNGFVIGGDDGWGIKNVCMPASVGIGTESPERKLDVKGGVNIGSVEDDYLPSLFNWNYTLRLNARDNTSIGFHDAAHAVSSIRFNGNGFVIGGDDGWGVKNVYMPANVGIGTANPSHKLTVNGQVKSRGFVTDTSVWADYVFAPDYKLPSLNEVEMHIKSKGHLPDVPSEAELVSNGLDLGKMSATQMAQIEQLMLHVIALNKQVQAQAEEIRKLQTQVGRN